MRKISVGWCVHALVDDEDYEYLSQWKWRLSHNGYAIRSERVAGENKIIRMHRIVLERKLGHDDFEDTHHINWNKIDNQRENLQAVTHQQNQCGRCKRKDNTSGYVGVYWSKYDKKHKAVIGIYGKQKFLGLFNDPKMAARVRDLAAIKYHGEHAILNFPKKKES